MKVSKGDLLLQDQVLRDERWDEGEGQVGTDQVESDSVVHVVIGEEEVLLEEHGVESVQDLLKSNIDYVLRLLPVR